MKFKDEELFKYLSAVAAATKPSIEQQATNDVHNQTIIDLREQQFHNLIREILVCLFIYCFLYLIAFITIKILRKTKETDEYVIDYEDAVADRVRIWICTFALATCFGAVLLLPMSIIASEVIKIAPQSIYWKWLNSSLLHGLWNLIFLFSNLSLFIFLPFAHLFVESIGLPGSKKGIKSRFIETLIIIFFIIVILVGFSYVISAILDTDNAKLHSLLNISDYYLPFLYSCISFIGVLFLLICTPLGFARLFTIVSNLIMKSTFRNDSREDLEVAEFERTCLCRQIQDSQFRRNNMNSDEIDKQIDELNSQLNAKIDHIKKLKNQSKRLTVYRNLCYPIIMFFLLVLNLFGILMVAKNTFYVIFGKLPTTRLQSSKVLDGENNSSSITSLYTLGMVQTSFEIALIVYFIIASLIGFYTTPFFKKILPQYKSTPMDKIILNCAFFLTFSSALPVSSKILGLTRFDLLGHFGDLHWLSNVHIILIYNFGFTIATVICLITKFTATVRSELFNRALILIQNAFLQTTTSTTPLFLNSPYSTTSISSTNQNTNHLKIN